MKVYKDYADKVKFKAKMENLSMENLVKSSIPSSESQRVRKIEKEVNNWRSKQRSSKGSSVFIKVPWLKDNK
jgi:hypothetical protein